MTAFLPRLFASQFILATCLSQAGAHGLSAQDRPWVVSLTVGHGLAWGSARDTAAGGGVTLGPDGPFRVGTSVARRLGRWGAGLMAWYGRADLVLDGPDLRLVDRTTSFRYLEIAPVVQFEATRLGHDASLLLVAGPVVGTWRLTGQPDRTRVGAVFGVAWPVWFGDRVGGIVRLEGLALPSVFEEGELPVEFERSATLRIQLSLGVVAGF
jgi:hypothetical protein